MTGPYKLTLKLDSGKIISGYIPASLAAGKYINLDTNGIATADSPSDFIAADNNVITDIYTTAPSGAFEFISAGNNTNCIFDVTVHQSNTTASRPAPGVRLTAGRQYRLKVVGAFAA